MQPNPISIGSGRKPPQKGVKLRKKGGKGVSARKANQLKKFNQQLKKKSVKKSKKFVPLIHYAKGSGHLHNQIRDMDIQGLSLDWRDDMRYNRENYGEMIAFQGNLDPSKLHGSTDVAKEAAARVLKVAGGKPGHIFNLGHGFAPSARIDCVEAVIRTVCGDIP